MIRRVEDPVVPHVPPTSPEPVGSRRLAVAGVAILVAFGALVGGVTLDRIVSTARGTRVEVVAAPGPDEAVDPSAAQLARWISAESILWTIEGLARPELRGRDTPSAGLTRAQDEVARRFAQAGLASPPDVGGMVHSFEVEALEFGRTAVETPDVERCRLAADGLGPFELYRDFVPLSRSSEEEPTFRGEASAAVVFAGYGIDSDSQGYDDFARVDVDGRVAVVLAGEPSIEGRFGGDDVTAEASVWNKLDALAREGAAGALVVHEDDGVEGRLPFHVTRARWNPPDADRVRRGIPTLVVTRAVAEAVLGRRLDALESTSEGDGPLSVIPADGASPGPRVTLSAATARAPATLRNIVGWLEGSDPDLRGEYVVVGAHLDHIGVGPRGRIGRGADDNASGVAAMIAVAEALRKERPARSVLFAAFTGEEDGLLGSRALAADLPLGVDACRAMVNLDMIGRGASDEVVVFGLDQDAPQLAAAVRSALATGATGLERVRAVENRLFFTRSDHYSFHEVGVPSIFFFEAWPHDSPDYHTWRDVPESVDAVKVRRTAILTALVVRELASR